MPWGRDAWVLRGGGRWACGAARLAASASFHWLRHSSVSSAWSNARVWGAGTGADAAVSRCCRDAAAGAAALTRGASSERHRGGAGGDAAGSERGARRPPPLAPAPLSARDGAAPGLWSPPSSSWSPQNQVRGGGGEAAAETGGGREPIGGGERSEGRGRQEGGIGGRGRCRAERAGWGTEEAKRLRAWGSAPSCGRGTGPELG